MYVQFQADIYIIFLYCLFPVSVLTGLPYLGTIRMLQTIYCFLCIAIVSSTNVVSFIMLSNLFDLMDMCVGHSRV